MYIPGKHSKLYILLRLFINIEHFTNWILDVSNLLTGLYFLNILITEHFILDIYTEQLGFNPTSSHSPLKHIQLVCCQAFSFWISLFEPPAISSWRLSTSYLTAHLCALLSNMEESHGIFLLAILVACLKGSRNASYVRLMWDSISFDHPPPRDCSPAQDFIDLSSLSSCRNAYNHPLLSNIFTYYTDDSSLLPQITFNVLFLSVTQILGGKVCTCHPTKMYFI